MRCPTLRGLPPPSDNKTGWPWTAETPQAPDLQPNGRPWPRISIVTPSFNQAQFIEATIRSVLLQGYPNLEYIVIDGGSTDGSAEIIGKYAKWLTYWVSEKDGGHACALNKGFSKSTGEIMAWLNSDDLYLPSSLFTVSTILCRFPDICWITGKNSWFDEHGTQAGCASVYKNVYDFLLGRYKWIQQESTFWRRSLWTKSGASINEETRYMVDGDLWCRFFLLTKLWHADSVLGGYRIHQANRASLYHKDVINEMNSLIVKLKRVAPFRIKARFTALRALQKLFSIAPRLGFTLHAFMYLYSYNKITRFDGNWVKTTAEFRI